MGAVVAELDVDRLPLGRAVFEVDVGDQPLDLVDVLDVLGHVLAAGLQVGEEGDAVVELGMLLKEHVEGLEAPQDVLGKVGAIDTHDERVTAVSLQLSFAGLDLRSGGKALEVVDVDGNGVPPDRDLAAVDEHAHVSEADLPVEQLLTSQQEVPG